MRSGEEIQRALTTFAARWAGYAGGERSEAQTFLNELFACYGSDRHAVGAAFEDFRSSAGFMDLHWPGTLIVEMKAPTVAVASAREQVERYWRESADEPGEVPAARWVVLCNFTDFEVWEPGRFPGSARTTFTLAQLPQRYEALMFLTGPEVAPSFMEHHKELTAVAARTVAAVHRSLLDRSAAPPDEIIRFTLQSVWTMFAEDLGLLAGTPFQRTVDLLRRDPSRSAARELGALFRVLDKPGDRLRTGLLAGTRYVNGQLFADPAEIDLHPDELDLLASAAERDWGKVDPTIFGSLLEGMIDTDRRRELGAHYTHEAEILKVVEPTIVRPWQERIDATTTPSGARALLDELVAFTVLDPACGCGNFLYVAYRELRSLEHQLKQRTRDLAASTGLPEPAGPWPYYPLSNLRGIDIEPTAVLIARVTLWMGHRQMIDRFGEAENPLPLVTLSGISVGDAVFSPWPDADCVIGNPPFYGDRKIRRVHGGAYVEALKRRFGVGVVDYSAYWFRRTQAHLADGGRAGLVSTNTLRENKHRRASLDHLVATGGVITDAVSSQKWPGEARVHVSITSWVKNPPEPVGRFTLDGHLVDGITAQLRPGADAPEPRRLTANRGRIFIGCQPSGEGFLVDDATADRLRAAGEGEVVRRYLTTDDITDAVGAVPSRWIIDFSSMPLEAARRYPQALAIVRREVKPEIEHKPEQVRFWWRFWRPRPAMRHAIEGRSRYIASTLTGKRLLFVWADPAWCPSNSTAVIAMDDDYAMGILSSRAHGVWARFRSSSFETRLRYTPSTAFETYPWPSEPTQVAREAVAEAARAVVAERARVVDADHLGLTELYNLVDDGAYAGLLAAHRRLDVAVAAAYGWPAAVAQDDDALVTRLVALNTAAADDPASYHPF